MRLMGYRHGGVYGVGVVDGETVAPLTAVVPEFPGDLAAILAAPDGLSRIRDGLSVCSQRLPLSDVDFDLPMRNPGKVVCVGHNYDKHRDEMSRDQIDFSESYPSLFLRIPQSLVAHQAPMIRPLCSEKLDFEAELVAVVGKAGLHIPQERALDHVAGYACFNDASVRDFRLKDSQWTTRKNFDATGGFGPWMVTADELPAGASGLKIESRLNGEVMQSASTSEMIFGVAAMISLISESMTLYPGDLVVTGTPEGGGHNRPQPVYMRDGDVCEIEIEGVGVLRNPIRDEQAGK